MNKSMTNQKLHYSQSEVEQVVPDDLKTRTRPKFWRKSVQSIMNGLSSGWQTLSNICKLVKHLRNRGYGRAIFHPGVTGSNPVDKTKNKNYRLDS